MSSISTGSAERLAVELDSPDHHGLPAFSERDRRRREELAMAGIETIRITGTRLKHEPREVAGRVAELLDRRHHASLGVALS